MLAINVGPHAATTRLRQLANADLTLELFFLKNLVAPVEAARRQPSPLLVLSYFSGRLEHLGFRLILILVTIDKAADLALAELHHILRQRARLIRKHVPHLTKLLVEHTSVDTSRLEVDGLRLLCRVGRQLLILNLHHLYVV